MFLIGMIVMTEGLSALTGKTTRSALMRFTHTPLSGAAVGAASTAIMQSSSATTVAAVGFVGSGLMRFQNALGIIFGANLGTTVTGWMVALLGFKLKLGLLVLPLIFTGAILRLFAKGTWANVGYALAGFGLIFVGITTLQEGMQDLQGFISFEHFPAASLPGRLKLLALGIIFTIITQSSSAGVASALTALYTGIINFEQAAALIIGMDIGTTGTAVMATVGGSVDARRTGFSHVFFNLFTGVVALSMISPYIKLWGFFAPGLLLKYAEIALVGFHTTFNMIGVILALPLTHVFATFIEKLVPEKTLVYTQHLEDALLDQPTLALRAAQSAINKELIALLVHVNAILGDLKTGARADLNKLQNALDKTQAYINRIHLHKKDGTNWERLIALIHTLDHLQRLHERCEEEEDRALTVKESVSLNNAQTTRINSNNLIIDDLINKRWTEAYLQANKTRKEINKINTPYRAAIAAKIGSGKLDVHEGTDLLEAIRWLRRVSIHIARITLHLEQAVLVAGK